MTAHRNFTHNSNFLFGSNLFDENTTYAIQTTNLPGIAFNHISVNKSSVQGFLQGDTTSFNDLNINIIIDEKLEIWKSLFKIFLKMREQDEGTGTENIKNSWLEIQDDNSNKVLKLYFTNCMISDIGDLEFNTTDEDEIITLPVSIKYDYFKLED